MGRNPSDMTQAATKYDRYLSDFHQLENGPGTNGVDWVHTLRRHALDRFSELGFPTARRGNEKWKYTNVAPIAKAAFGYSASDGEASGSTKVDIRRMAPWRDGWLNLVFVNGHFSEALSDSPLHHDGVNVTSLAQAIVADSEAVEPHLARYASVDDDGFTALNTAFLQDGAFIQISAGASLDSPINLVFLSTGREGDPSVSHPRVLLVADANARATIFESYVGYEGDRYFTNSVTETVVGDGAEVDHYRLLEESDAAYHVGVARVHLGENSVFSSNSFSKSAALGRYDLSVLMDGPGGSCTLRGLYQTTGNQHIDNLINIDHAQPRCTSRLSYKGILDGKSRAVFGGTVWVREGAIKTDALQSDKNLVLSPDAEVDSKPALFIYADDVKCGHGATAGNIDPETVFYMRSRGVDLEAASRLLIYGFASEIIEAVQQDPLREYLERLFLESLPSYEFQF